MTGDQAVPIAPELKGILEKAERPCPNFGNLGGPCRDAKWCPARGYIPRGFAGASRDTQSVKLVIITAEPGDPAEGEHYAGSPSERVDKHWNFAMNGLREGVRRNGKPVPFQVGLRKILNLCWPKYENNLDEQLARTWLTQTVLCSAEKSGGRVPPEMERKCGETYLKKELAVFPSAFILALGGKAAGRLKMLGITPNARAHHPSARLKGPREASWAAAAAEFRAWLCWRQPRDGDAWDSKPRGVDATAAAVGPS